MPNGQITKLQYKHKDKSISQSLYAIPYSNTIQEFPEILTFQIRAFPNQHDHSRLGLCLLKVTFWLFIHLRIESNARS